MLLNPDAWFTVRPATASVQPTVVIDVSLAWAVDDHVEALFSKYCGPVTSVEIIFLFINNLWRGAFFLER